MYTICENPEVIFHPNVISFAQRADYIYRDGELSAISNNDIDYIFRDFSFWLNMKFPSPKQVTDVKLFYFVDATGEMFPVYLEVPCGKCTCCRMKRLNSYVQQAEFEMLSSYVYAEHFFVTLTYSDENLPGDVSQPYFKGELVKKHVQDYIKRIRSYICKRYGKEYSKRMKVMYSGEYGSNFTCRPHYHVVFFHFPYYLMTKEYPPYKILRLFEYFWSKPHYNNEEDVVTFDDYNINQYCHYDDKSLAYKKRYVNGIVDVCKLKNGNIAKYIGKYIAKGCKTEAGRAKSFFNKSINFGMRFFTEHVVSQLRDNKKNTFVYKNLSSKIKEDAHCCSYYLSKLFPPISRIIPAEVRRSYIFIRDTLHQMKATRLFHRNKWLLEHVEKYCPDINLKYYHFEQPLNECIFSFRSMKKLLFENVHRIAYFFNDYDIDELRDYVKERATFLNNSFTDISIPDAIFDLQQQSKKLQLQIKL